MYLEVYSLYVHIFCQSINIFQRAYTVRLSPWKWVAFFFLKICQSKNLSNRATRALRWKHKSKWHLGGSHVCFTIALTSQNHSNSRVSLALIQLITFLSLKKGCGKTTVLSFSNPSGKMMQSQEIISATLRFLKGTWYCPWGKETGNPIADLKPVRKSSWLCLQNTSRMDHLPTPPLLPPWVKGGLSADYSLASYPAFWSSPPPPPGNSPHGRSHSACVKTQVKLVPPLKESLWRLPSHSHLGLLALPPLVWRAFPDTHVACSLHPSHATSHVTLVLNILPKMHP